MSKHNANALNLPNYRRKHADVFWLCDSLPSQRISFPKICNQGIHYLHLYSFFWMRETEIENIPASNRSLFVNNFMHEFMHFLSLKCHSFYDKNKHIVSDVIVNIYVYINVKHLLAVGCVTMSALWEYKALWVIFFGSVSCTSTISFMPVKLTIPKYQNLFYANMNNQIVNLRYINHRK